VLTPAALRQRLGAGSHDVSDDVAAT
jgi:hypothetical protein